MMRPGMTSTPVPWIPKAPNTRIPMSGPTATPTVPAVTYTDIPALRRHRGSSARTSSAPNGWNAPDPSPEASASRRSSGKLLTKPTSENVSAVQHSARPVNRVPNRSARTPKRGWDTAAMPPYARLTSPTVARLRWKRPIKIG